MRTKAMESSSTKANASNGCGVPIKQTSVPVSIQQPRLRSSNGEPLQTASCPEGGTDAGIRPGGRTIPLSGAKHQALFIALPLSQSLIEVSQCRLRGRD